MSVGRFEQLNFTNNSGQERPIFDAPGDAANVYVSEPEAKSTGPDQALIRQEVGRKLPNGMVIESGDILYIRRFPAGTSPEDIKQSLSEELGSADNAKPKENGDNSFLSNLKSNRSSDSHKNSLLRWVGKKGAKHGAVMLLSAYALYGGVTYIDGELNSPKEAAQDLSNITELIF